MSIQPISSQMDVQRAKAEKFVNASDKTINRLARRNYNKLYSEEDKKFDKRVGTTLKTLPFVAAASAFAMGKGKKGALLSGLTWGMALAAPVLVATANKSLVKNNPKVANAERKHPIAALAGNIAASVGAFMGMTSIANTVLANPKTAELGAKFSAKAGNMFKSVSDKVAPLAEKIKMPEAVKNTISKVKVPESVKNGMKKLVEHPVVKDVAGFAKDLGKGLVKNAPILLVFGTMGALIGKGVANANKYTAIKSEIKDAQFNTAKNLVNAYSAENAELKSENAKLANANAEEAPADVDAENVE